MCTETPGSGATFINLLEKAAYMKSPGNNPLLRSFSIPQTYGISQMCTHPAVIAKGLGWPNRKPHHHISDADSWQHLLNYRNGPLPITSCPPSCVPARGLPLSSHHAIYLPLFLCIEGLLYYALSHVQIMVSTTIRQTSSCYTIPIMPNHIVLGYHENAL